MWRRATEASLRDCCGPCLLTISDHTISILHAFLPNDEDKDNFTNVYFAMEHMDVVLQTKACAHLQCTDAIR